MNEKQVLNQERRIRKMEQIDNLPPAVRAVVHVAGWGFVKLLLDAGIRKPRKMWAMLESARGVAAGNAAIRDSPTDAEIQAIIDAMRHSFKHNKGSFLTAARHVARVMFYDLRWGRCQCMGTLPIAYKQPMERQ